MGYIFRVLVDLNQRKEFRRVYVFRVLVVSMVGAVFLLLVLYLFTRQESAESA